MPSLRILHRPAFYLIVLLIGLLLLMTLWLQWKLDLLQEAETRQEPAAEVVSPRP